MADDVIQSDGNLHTEVYKPLTNKTNRICTSKYTCANFLILNLWEQFHSLANVYFLVLMLFQMIPQISITYGKPTLGLPLSIVLAVAAVKDALEDLKKHEADQAENESKVQLLDPTAGPTAFTKAPKDWPKQDWQTVCPGHLVRLEMGDRIPADLLLLHSSEPSRSCNVETMNLDGETNLKLKACAMPDNLTWKQLEGFAFSYEPPTQDLYEFQGCLHKDELTIGVGISNLLLRGSGLATSEVIGMAVYCGHDTRIMCNASSVRLKRSHLDIAMNYVMVFIFIFELLCSVLAGVFYVFWEIDYGDDHWYLQLAGEDARSPLYAWAVKTGTWILQMSNMVPISLMVSITVVKFAQGLFIKWDAKMYDKVRRVNASVQCSQVLESVGQITHVFSDKTGTLTCNEMRYKACSVNQQIYGLSFESESGSASTVPNVDFSDSHRFLEKIDKLEDGLELSTMTNFLLCKAVCHTVNILNDSDSHKSGWRPDYGADSPDELALVSCAAALGLTFEKVRGAVSNCIACVSSIDLVLRVSDKRLYKALKLVTGFDPDASEPLLTVTVLNICEFDNVRKRMSVVARYPNGKVMLHMKGADSSVLADDVVKKDRIEAKCAEEHLLNFARRGLRTLCLTCRELGEEERRIWHSQYKTAFEDMSDNRSDLVTQQVMKIESGMDGWIFLGATAIEDRLQDRVPQVISDLRRADIMVWVLTGDKLETAISIGKSCKLLSADMMNFELSKDDLVEDVLEELTKWLNGTERRPEEAATVTIVGSVLKHVLADPGLAQKFFLSARRCKSVLCCRVSPKQKATVVERAMHYYSNDNPVSLAIGDGANDVAMINTAHVGIGLSGKEGAQAARAADFSFSEFQYLSRLLFVHGIESYRRNSVLVCYNFYKNMILVMAPYFYGWYMSFSGQPFYDQVLYQFFNVVFTCVPIICFALFDRPVSRGELESKGQVDYMAYRAGRGKEYFNTRVFLCWIAAGMIQALCMTQLAFLLFGDGTTAAGITSGDLWSEGTVIFMWVIVGVSLTLWRRMTLTFWFSNVAIVVSCLLQPAALFVLSNILKTYFLRGTFTFMYTTGFPRFAMATVLAMGIHLIVGEPLISSAVYKSKKPTSSNQYEYCSVTSDEDSPRESDKLSALRNPRDLPVRKSTLTRARTASLITPVDSYNPAYVNQQCSIERREHDRFGRRNSIQHHNNTMTSQFSRLSRDMS